MELRIEGLDLLQQAIDQLLAGHQRKTGNVVDRLFRIELGALPARPIQNVNQMALEIQQPQLKHGKQADGPVADDGEIRFVGLRNFKYLANFLTYLIVSLLNYTVFYV